MNISMLDLIAIISFVLQVDNNDELNRQTSNDEVLKRLHDDVMKSIEDNRQLCSTIISQNDDIIKKLEELLCIKQEK